MLCVFRCLVEGEEGKSQTEVERECDHSQLKWLCDRRLKWAYVHGVGAK